MKTLNEYMAIPYCMEIVEDQDEGGYVVSFPDLPGCLTCGETVEQAMENAVDAKRVWLKAALEDDRENLFLFDVAGDPFYSENNMQRLRRSVAQMEATGGTVHEVNLDD